MPTSTAHINRTVLMSGVDYFNDLEPINPYMNSALPIDRTRAKQEHDLIRAAVERAGVAVQSVAPPPDSQDGVYTANWALVRGKTAVLARLPFARKAEEAFAEKVLTTLGKKVVHVPGELRFSGQGDALPCGNYLFTGAGYRSDEPAQRFAANILGYVRIQLQTIPQLSPFNGQPIINHSSGWPDSFFYDIDLALAVIHPPVNGRPALIAWCPQAFTAESQATLRNLTDIEKIEVSLQEATEAFACNLLSTGSTVIMSGRAPQLRAALEARGFSVIAPEITELLKGGGFIRCTTLTLDNE